VVDASDSVFKWRISSDVESGTGYTIRMMAKSDSSEFDVNNTPLQITGNRYYFGLSYPYTGAIINQGLPNLIDGITNVKDDSALFQYSLLRDGELIDTIGTLKSDNCAWRSSPNYPQSGKYQILVTNEKYNISDTSGVFFLRRSSPVIKDVRVQQSVRVVGLKDYGPMQNGQISILWDSNVDGDIDLELYKDGNYYGTIDSAKYNYDKTKFDEYFIHKYTIDESIDPGDSYYINLHNNRYGIDARSDTFSIKVSYPLVPH
jgi:hypothetical protein